MNEQHDPFGEFAPSRVKFNTPMDQRGILKNATLRQALTCLGTESVFDMGWACMTLQLEQIWECVRLAVHTGAIVHMGYMPDVVIRERSTPAHLLYGAGHIDHPFRDPYILIHDWEPDAKTRRHDPDRDDVLPRMTCGYLVCPVKHDAKPMRYVVCEFYFYMWADMAGIIPASLVICEGGTRMEILGYIEDPAEMQEYKITNVCHSAREPVLAAIGILSTKGVPSETRQDRRRHAVYLPAHYRVDTANYITAVRGASGGGARGHSGRASPIPHIRRGHVREFKAGGSVWIHDALVNCDSSNEISFAERHRSAYTRKTV